MFSKRWSTFSLLSLVSAAALAAFCAGRHFIPAASPAKAPEALSVKPAPGSDKLARFAAHSIVFEAGRVLLPSQAPWLEEYIREITGFPGAKHDDQVDSTSQALENLNKQAKSDAFWNGLSSYLASRYRRYDDY